jgi:D-threo-aldose 1-dehydrogenase
MSQPPFARKSIRHTDIPLPPIGLGTAPLGNLYQPILVAQAVETVQFALSQGMNYIDTAPHYADGLSETRVGLALQGVPRDHYILETKVGKLQTADGDWVWDFSRDGVLRSLEGSLSRLGVDRIDILLVHDPDRHYQQARDEAFAALLDLRRQGVVRAIGAGMNQWQMLVDFAAEVDVDCFMLAGRYTLLEHTALDALNQFNARGIGVLAAGVYNSGILATGSRGDPKYNYRAPDAAILARVRRIEAVCARYAVSLPSAALHFVGAHPAVASLVIGAESAAQLAQTLAYYRAAIPHDFWTTLRDEGLIPSDAPIPS